MEDTAEIVELLNALKAINVKSSTLGSLSVGQLRRLTQQGIIDVNSFCSLKPHNLAKAGLTPEQQADIGAAMVSVQNIESVFQAERRLMLAKVVGLMSSLDAHHGDNQGDNEGDNEAAPLPPEHARHTAALKKSLRDLKAMLNTWESQQ